MRSRGADGRLCGKTCCCCCGRTSRDGGGCDVRADCRRCRAATAVEGSRPAADGRDGGRAGEPRRAACPRRADGRRLQTEDGPPQRAAEKTTAADPDGQGLLLPSREQIDDARMKTAGGDEDGPPRSAAGDDELRPGGGGDPAGRLRRAAVGGAATAEIRGEVAATAAERAAGRDAAAAATTKTAPRRMEAATGGETCCCDMTTVRKKMGLGLRVAAPRSKIDAPRGSAAATRVAAPDLNLELCYHVTNEKGRMDQLY